MGIARSISRKRLGGGYRPNGMPGTTCLSGHRSCAQRSFCGSHFAANVPAGVSGHALRLWTTSCLIGEIGTSSLTQRTTKACASPVTTVRRPKSKRKNGEKRGEFELLPRRKATSAYGCVRPRRRARVRRRAQGKACGFPTLPPPSESFEGRGARPRGPSDVRKCPRSGNRNRKLDQEIGPERQSWR